MLVGIDLTFNIRVAPPLQSSSFNRCARLNTNIPEDTCDAGYKERVHAVIDHDSSHSHQAIGLEFINLRSFLPPGLPFLQHGDAPCFLGRRASWSY